MAEGRQRMAKPLRSSVPSGVSVSVSPLVSPESERRWRDRHYRREDGQRSDDRRDQAPNRRNPRIPTRADRDAAQALRAAAGCCATCGRRSGEAMVAVWSAAGWRAVCWRCWLSLAGRAAT